MACDNVAGVNVADVNVAGVNVAGVAWFCHLSLVGDRQFQGSGLSVWPGFFQLWMGIRLPAMLHAAGGLGLV